MRRRTRCNSSFPRPRRPAAAPDADGADGPGAALQAALALFRRGDLAALAPLLPPDALGPGARAPALLVGGRAVVEPGPLAPLAGVLCVGARRVLPGHLLRRSAVVAALRPDEGTWLPRTVVTAARGEEAVLDWRLERLPACGRWVVASAARDAAATDEPLPGAPRPRGSPEAAVAAQLAALARGDAAAAAAWCHVAAGGPDGFAAFRAQRDAFCAALAARGGPLAPLLRHGGARLGAAALLGPAEMVQEVAVAAAGGGGGAPARFAWRLALGADGAWRVAAVEPCD